MTRYILFILFISIFASACQQPAAEMPQDLAGLKKMLKSKETEVKALETSIAEIKEKIEILEPATEKVKKSVTTFQLESEEYKSYTELQGNIESSDAVMISAEMGGRLTSLTIDEGDFVRKGQIVGTVDMESLKSSISELETSLELATTVYDRQKRLWDQKIGSEIQFLQAKNNKERIEKSLATIRTNLSKEYIKSPMSGYVDIMFLKSGELTAPGTPIASVINTKNVKAVVDVPENMITAVKKGDRVSINFPALGTEKTARVNMVGRSINSANRTFKIEINLANGNGILKPNLLVLTKINDKTIKDALLLPIELVQQDVSGKSYVYTVAEGQDGPYAQKNIVETGDSANGKIIVTSGLTAGDQIINSGARGLAKEELIQIKNESK